MPTLYEDVRDIKICNSNVAVCGVIFSVWGIIQLSIMGIAFCNNSVAFVHDLPEVDYHKFNSTEEIKGEMNRQFKISAKNCGIAAAMYLLTFLFSVHQVWVNGDRGIRVDRHGVLVEGFQSK